MTRKCKNSPRAAVRRVVRLLPLIEQSNIAALGEDEVAARVRRYVAAHEAPSDDPTGFARMCDVIIAQGLGFGAVEKNRAELASAFYGYVPAAVAQIDAARIGVRLSEPIFRDRHKIESIIENARRWLELATVNGSYLGRFAKVAADDDAAAGWPALVALLLQDFVSLRETTARVLLKHWGFFTANAHLGARRMLMRLGMLDATTDGPALQRFVAGIAQAASQDPYGIEATFAIFAGTGPCQVTPLCVECALSQKCPTGSQATS